MPNRLYLIPILGLIFVTGADARTLVESYHQSIKAAESRMGSQNFHRKLQKPLIKSPVDFFIHTWAHIARVEALGNRLIGYLAKNPNLTKSMGIEKWNPQLAASCLQFHDRAKVEMSGPFLKRHNINAAEHPVHVLVEYFGEIIPPSMRHHVEQLNRMDASEMRLCMKNNGLIDGEGKPTDEGRIFKVVEKVADLVDAARSLDRAVEFGRRKNRPVSTVAPGPYDKPWFIDDVELELAYELEMNYFETVKGKSFADFKSDYFLYLSEMQTLECEIRILH